MSRTVLGAGATAVALGALVTLALVIGTGLQHAPWPLLAPDHDGAPEVDLGAAGGAASGAAADARDQRAAASLPAGDAPAVAIDGLRGAGRDAGALRRASALPGEDLTPGGADERRPRPEAGPEPAPGAGRAPSPAPEGGAGASTPGARPVATPGAGGETARPGTGRGDGARNRGTRDPSAEPGTHGISPGPARGGPVPGGAPVRLTATRIASGPPRLAATTTTSAPSRHRHAPQRRSMRTPKARPRGHRPHVGNAARATPPSEVVAAAPRHAKAVAERGHERRPKALANREHDPPAKAVPNGRPRGAM